MSTRTRKKTAWERAQAYGIDTTLLEANLDLSHTERALQLMHALELVRELQQAGKRYYAQHRRTSKTPHRSSR